MRLVVGTGNETLLRGQSILGTVLRKYFEEHGSFVSIELLQKVIERERERASFLQGYVHYLDWE